MKIKATVSFLAAGLIISTMGACASHPYASAEEITQQVMEESTIEQVVPAAEESLVVEIPDTIVEGQEETAEIVEEEPAEKENLESGIEESVDETTEEKARSFNDVHLNYWMNHGTVYEHDDITEEMLLNRTDDRVIIEHIRGMCMDDEGNGKVLNTQSEYNYIAYNNVFCTADVKMGDIVDTYFVYDPACNYTDCTIERIDFVTSHCDSETKVVEKLYR